MSLLKKVWMVTQGSYSDFEIVQCFDSKEKAMAKVDELFMADYNGFLAYGDPNEELRLYPHGNGSPDGKYKKKRKDFTFHDYKDVWAHSNYEFEEYDVY